MYKQSGININSICIEDGNNSFDSKNDPIMFNFDNKFINLIDSFQNLDFDVSSKIIKEITDALTLKNYVIIINKFDFNTITKQFLAFFDPDLYRNMIDSMLSLLVAWTYYQDNNQEFLQRKLFNFLFKMIEDKDELMDSRKYAMYLLGNVMLDFPEGCDLVYDLNGIEMIINGIPCYDDSGYAEAAIHLMNIIAINVNDDEKKSSSLISFLKTESISSLYYYNFAYTTQCDFLFLLNFIKASEQTALFIFGFINFHEFFNSLDSLDSVSSNKYGLVGLFKVLKALLKKVPERAVCILQSIKLDTLKEFFEKNKVSSNTEEALCKFLYIFFQNYHDLILLAIQSNLINLLKKFLENSSLKIKFKVLEIFNFIYTIDSNTYPIDITDDKLINLLLNLLETDWETIILQILILLDLIVQKCIVLESDYIANILSANDLEMCISPLTVHKNKEISEKAITLEKDLKTVKKMFFFYYNDEDDDMIWNYSDELEKW